MATPLGNSVPLTGDAKIDGLTWGGKWTFSGSHTLTYSLNSTSFSPYTWTSEDATVAARAFAAWAAVANITFTKVTSGQDITQSTADIAIGPAGGLLFEEGAAGLAVAPDAAYANLLLTEFGYNRSTYPRPEGDIYLDEYAMDFAYTDPGGRGFSIVLHEIGHALGLKHPHDDGPGGRPTFSNLGMAALDSEKYTLMSYNDAGWGLSAGYAATPMPLDILAIQHIYGANWSYKTGNDTYILASDGILKTVWDAGGVDTFSASGMASAVQIDLNAGAYSYHGSYSTTAIAYGVVIENATGGAGNDTILGNTANNVLNGGGGADSLKGGPGNDTYLIDSLDTVTELANEGTDSIQAGFSYVLGNHLENLALTGSININGTGNTLANVITGNSGNNALSGNDGNDTLNGGGGNDSLDGGLGADSLTGGTGNDTYVIDSSDTLTELANEGTDSVQAGFSYALGNHLENLTLTGSTNINGTGNTLANVITGNSGNNALSGNDGNDTLNGGGGNDSLDGGLGADSLTGGTGNDTYVIDSSDTLTELANEGTDSVQAGFTYVLGNHLENLVLTGSGNINGSGNTLANVITGNSGNNALSGNDGNDTLNGGGGNDSLDGGLGADSLIGGAGDDTYVIDSSDTLTELANEGTDSVQAGFSYALGNHLENLALTGSSNINGTGNTLANVITGNSGNNELSGNDGNDTLNGGGGNDSLDGGTGTDTLTGGTGNDAYVVDDGADSITENPNEGTDTVKVWLSWALGSNLENLVLLGNADLNGTGNAVNNSLTGNAGANVLDGLAGEDAMAGGAGDDTYVVDNIGDSVSENAGEGGDSVFSGISFTLAANVEDLTLTGAAALNGTGNDLDNSLTGNAGNNSLQGGAGNDTLQGLDGNDSLDGGLGADTLTGGAGDDTYVVDSSDTLTELANEGADSVQAGFTYALGNHLENLTLSGNGDIDGIGNALDNNIIGNSGINNLAGNDGDDILDGGLGADALAGGQGNDIYYLDDPGDTLTELANEGTDSVQAGFSYALGNHLENLALTGSSNINGTGNTLANVITGNSGNNELSGNDGNDTLNGGGGNDSLDGGTGTDTLTGGTGNDAYVVDDGADSITENPNEGTDTVKVWLSWALGSNLENLVLLGNADLNGTGNAVNNSLTGNAGANVLDGLAGGDAMAGGAGDDTYVVDNIGDSVSENAGEGGDSVFSGISFTLAANVEDLTLTGAAALNGTGNSLANVITGNSGNNALSGNDGNDTLNGGGGNDSLDGGLGADSLIGGAGDDTYVIDSSDTLTELANEGTDSVQAGFSYALGNHLENLALTGSSNINGTGNTLANVITGNSGNNELSGNDGNDTLNGGGGNDSLDGGTGTDTLTGGTGNDAYVVDDGADSITENPNEGTDTVKVWLSWALGSNLENLVLLGNADLNGTGNAVNNSLTGNAGANVLDGLAGGDAMAGGAGDDTYWIDNVGDGVTENFDEGHDSVYSGISFTLAANVEDMTLTGAAALNGTGNDIDNSLTGNASANGLQGGAGNDTLLGMAGNDSLDGGLGADTLAGGAGDDSYTVDDVGDVVTELDGEGLDTVFSSVGIALPDYIEFLILTGNGDIDLTGQQGDNALTGNAGDNLLDGGRGWDKLAGGTGDDTYLVDQMGDLLTEAANAGLDHVQALVSYALGLNLENLTLGEGAGNLDGTGNSLANALTGNGGMNTLDGGDGNDFLWGLAGDDVLKGGNGNDELSGGLGADLLTGGAGNDRFVFDTDPGIGGNTDWINDFVKGQDKLVLDDDVFAGLGPVGTLGAGLFRTGVNIAAVDADDRVLYDSASGSLYYDADGSGFEAAVLVAALSGHPTLTAADVMIAD